MNIKRELEYGILLGLFLSAMIVACYAGKVSTPQPLDIRLDEMERRISELEKRLQPSIPPRYIGNQMLLQNIDCIATSCPSAPVEVSK